MAAHFVVGAFHLETKLDLAVDVSAVGITHCGLLDRVGLWRIRYYVVVDVDVTQMFDSLRSADAVDFEMDIDDT